MPKRNSTAPKKPIKPDGSPLFPHATKRWAKKIRGKLHYFGPWTVDYDAGHEAALARYLSEKDALHSGRKPRSESNELTVVELADAFLVHKKALQDAGELTPRTWADYKQATDFLVKHFGRGRVVEDIHPDEFGTLRAKLVKRWGPIRVGNMIQRIRSVFKFATDERLIQRPVVFGQSFKRPSKKTLRLERAKKDVQMFEADELRCIIEAASPVMRAMVLLGINCGFGNQDVGTLPLSALNLERGVLDYARPKTGIPRRCPLWPETIAALEDAIAKRPTPKSADHAGLVFITKYGKAWAKVTGLLRKEGDKKGTTTPPSNPVSAEMRKLLDTLGIKGHRNFYALRHTLETIGGEVKDQVAVDFIMGHARDDMASVYRERLSDERLRAITDHVRAWLFGT